MGWHGKGEGLQFDQNVAVALECLLRETRQAQRVASGVVDIGYVEIFGIRKFCFFI